MPKILVIFSCIVKKKMRKMKKKKKLLFVKIIIPLNSTTTIINVSYKISRNEAVRFKNSFVTV